jgi:mono/diheme cytochrome c family protein
MRAPLGRTTRRPPLAALAGASIALAMATGGCAGGDRADRTADSAFAPITDSSAHLGDSAATVARDSSTADTTAQAPRDTTPLLLVAVDSAIGDSLYQNSRGRCLSCHGPRGTGNGKLGPPLADSVRIDSDGSVAGIESVIRDGVAVPKIGTARMPAFGSQLDPVAIHRLAVYVYSLSHPGAIARDSAAARALLPAPTLPTAPPADTSSTR